MRPIVSVADKLGLSRVEAAEYVGVGVSLFDEMTRDGRMPQPRKVNSRLVWSRRDIEKSFEALPYLAIVMQAGESIQEWDVE